MEPAKVSLDNMFDALNEEYINARIEHIRTQQNSLIDMVKLNELIDLHGDFTIRVCPKSGTTLQTLDTYGVMRLLEICPDEDYAIALLKKQNIANPALHWLYDDGESLDKLMDIDPYGYFVYAAAYVCNNHSPLAHLNLRDRMAEYAAYEHVDADGNTSLRLRTLKKDEIARIRKLAEFDWVMQKKILRDKITQYPLEQIIRINEIMRRYLAFFSAGNIPEKFDTYSIMMDEICPEILPAVARDVNSFELYVVATLKQIIWSEVKAGRLSYGIDYDDVLKIRQRYQGLSNFFHQYQPNLMPERFSKTEIMLDGFMKLANIPGEQLAYRERIDRALKEKQMIAINANSVIAKPITKPVSFAFLGKKKEEDIIL